METAILALMVILFASSIIFTWVVFWNLGRKIEINRKKINQLNRMFTQRRDKECQAEHP